MTVTDHAAAVRASILLVDDRPENLIALEAILEPLGHDLVRASSGPEALREVLLRDFAVLLLDVQMPGMNGFELAKLIKSRERSQSVPIIFLTAISKEESYVFEGYTAGAVDYLFKPFNPAILRSKVTVFVDLYKAREGLRQQSALLRESEQREMQLRHRAELLESEAKFAAIVDSALDAIISVGADRTVTSFNASAERMFLCTADEAIGQPVDQWFTTPPAFPGERPPAAGPPAEEAFGVRANGDRFPIELTVSSLALREETVHTIILRDVSARRRAEEALRAQTSSLEDALEELRVVNEELNTRSVELEMAMGARSRFYASMSHELRTPINAILGFTSLLLDGIYGELTDPQLGALERTSRAAKHLLELVNDVLDLSKIEAGKMERQLESVPFPEIIQDLFVTVGPLAEQSDTDLVLKGDDPPVTVVSDARRIRQILLNLISNGIKFGQGKPVEVAWERREEGGVAVEVRDSGPGIREEDQVRVFQEFVQLEGSNGTPGTGLGLAISHRLAGLLEGSLTVRSEPGTGSVFRLELPADVALSPPTARRAEPVRVPE